MEFGIKQYLDTTNTKFNFVVRDTFIKGETIFGRITTKDILKSDTDLLFIVLRTNGDSVAMMRGFNSDTNTQQEFYTSGFGKYWSGGHFSKVYRVINWKKYLLDSVFFFIKTP